LENVVSWSGKGSDTFATAQRAFAMADVLAIEEWYFDSDGLGAGIRGDARVINEGRKRKQKVEPWRASGEVIGKEKPIETAAPRTEKKDPHSVERLNGDYYLNANAQAAFSMRARFQRTHRAVEMAAAGEDWRAAYDEDSLVSINSKMPELAQVLSQLSQPTYTQSTTGKMQIEKMPTRAGEPRMRSPNHFDAIKILYAPKKRGRTYRLEAFSE
jgi:hypothetical protein